MFYHANKQSAADHAGETTKNAPNKGQEAFFMLALIAVGLSVLFAGTSLAETRPNFLFFVAEDMGAQIGVMRTPEVKTPTLDSLAKNGVLFERAYTTCPTCSPSKASIMTGHYPHTHNLRINVNETFGPFPPELTDQQKTHNEKLAIPDSMPTLIEKLREGGYRTGVMKKFHLSPHDKFPYDAWFPSHNPLKIIDFIKDSGETPWFLMVGYDATHRKFRYDDEAVEPDSDGMELPAHLPPTDIVKTDWAEYLKAVQNIDSQVYDALSAIEASGQKEDTIVLFLGDHGPAYHRAKFSPYALGLHVPIIFSGPEALIHPREEAVSELVSFVDLMPTILDYAGIEIPMGLQGKSLRDLLIGSPDGKGHDYVFGEIHHGTSDTAVDLQERCIFDGRYRLLFRNHLEKTYKVPADVKNLSVWNNPVYEETILRRAEYPLEYGFLAQRDSSQPGTAPPFELYDTALDPWEINNVYGDPEYKTVSVQLIQELLNWVLETNDRYVEAAVLETELNRIENGSDRTGGSGSTCFVGTTKR